MDTQNFRSLQEAYLEVYTSQEELDEGREGGRFEYNQRHGRPLIDPASSQRRSEKETLGGGTYERGPKRLPRSKRKYDRQVLSGVRAASDQEKQRARKRMGIGENYDIYDIILSHLLDEGYADTQEAAEVIMVNMSEEWRSSIVEEVLDEANRAERELGLSSRERERARNLQGNLSKPIFYGKRNSQLGNTSDSGMNRMHKRLRNKRRTEHEERRGQG